ncbi:MAG: hypothetical protein FWD05_13920 [Oscillospiraceae bacterium]|nr:hypothetical protein [Oscillospiraceae bacterium]
MVILMSTEFIKKQALRFGRARSALIAVFVITVINLFLHSAGLDLQILYSAFFPWFLYTMMIENAGVAVWAGFFMGVICASVYLVCWALSKRWRVFVVVAMILFMLDAVVLIFVTLISGEFLSFLIDIAVCAWILYRLISGTIAFSSLNNISPEQLKLVQENISETENADELNSALNNLIPAQTEVVYQNQNTLYAPPNAYCGNCGHHVTYGAKYCGNCGYTLPYMQRTETQSYIAAPIQGETPQHISPAVPGKLLYTAGQTYEHQAQIDQYFKTQVINIYRYGESIDRLYMFDDIPTDKLNSAIASFAPSVTNDETAIILYVNTSGKSKIDGILLTTKALYYKKDVAPIQSVDNLSIPTTGVLRPSIVAKMLTRANIDIYVALSKKQTQALCDLLNQAITLMKDL